MTARSLRRWTWTSLALVVATSIGLVVVDQLLRSAGRADLAVIDLSSAGYLLTVAVSGAIGVKIALRIPRHPVGWLLLSLAFLINLAGIADGWARYALVARPGRPGGALAAVYDNSSFITWFVPLALFLLLTPDGHLPGPRWRWVARVAVVGAGVAFVVGMVTPGSIDSPMFKTVTNPIGQAWAGSPPITLIAIAGLVAVNVGGVLGGVASLFVRYRTARGVVRQQLLWVAFGAGALAVCIVNQLLIAALIGGDDATKDALLSLNGGFMLAALPVTTGIAILQYRLYDLGRLVSRSVSYLLLSGLVAGAYAVSVLALGEVVGRESPFAVASATLLAASLFGLARRLVQDRVDRRFNRRRWDALRMVDDFARRAEDGRDAGERTIEGVLASALGDPTLRVAYPLRSEDGWVNGKGEPAEEPQASGPDGVTEVRRGGVVVAALSHSAALEGGPALVAAVAERAATELENARLRAQVRVQLVEVQHSRARIVAAGDAERRRIERNLHDGAQQRLVALGLQLRTSRRRIGVDGELAEILDRAADELGFAVEELRELANGLHPSVLFDEGLGVALEALADRAPIVVRVEPPTDRVAIEVEAAAFYVACEGLSNAIKHAAAEKVEIAASVHGDVLVLRVVDDGVGGARLEGGSGLQGLVDRVEAVGGTLSLESRPGSGTTLTVELPCES